MAVLVGDARLRRVFIGSEGLRSGWGILLFLAMIGGLAIGLRLVAVAMHLPSKPPSGDQSPWILLIMELVQTSLILGLTWIMARIEGRRVWSFGLADGAKRPKFLIGMVGGWVCLSLVVLVLAASGYLVFDGHQLHGLAILGFGALWLLVFALVGLSEELMFRGYLQRTLARGIGFWPAAIVLSLLFAVAHMANSGESTLGLVGVVTAGLMLCLLLRVSGSLWLSIGWHTGWDWSQSYLYGTPDSGLMMKGHLFVSHAVGNPLFSGGATGPEASLLALPGALGGLLALVWVGQRLRLFGGAAPAGGVILAE